MISSRAIARVALTACLLTACSPSEDAPAGPDPGPAPRTLAGWQRVERSVRPLASEEVECPSGLDLPRELRTTRTCRESELRGQALASALERQLPPLPGTRLQDELHWDRVPDTDLGDGCTVTILNNLRPYPFRSEQGKTAWLVFWIVDRERCGRPTLLVLHHWQQPG